MDVYNKSGELCRKSGIQFGYHNHDFEFTHTFGTSTMYDVILQNTDPNLVKQQLDIGNIHQTGFTPKNLFIKYPGWFQSIHLKDLVENNDRHQPFKSTVIGEGRLDIKSIINDAVKYGGTIQFVIEQDDVGSNESFRNAKGNFEAFKKLEVVA